MAGVATIGSLWKDVGFDEERPTACQWKVGRCRSCEAREHVEETDWNGKSDEEKETATQQLRFGTLPRPLQVVKSP